MRPIKTTVFLCSAEILQINCRFTDLRVFTIIQYHRATNYFPRALQLLEYL